MKTKIVLLFITLHLPLSPWPFIQQQPKQFTLMLNGAGDAQQTGRKIDDTFERSIALHFIESLQQKLAALYPNLRVVLTRIPGQTTESLQNAQFANRLHVDLYVSIHCYQASSKSTAHIYYFSTGQPHAHTMQETFCPIERAHLQSHAKTSMWAQELAQKLKGCCKNAEINNDIGLPFAPLFGIQAPAIALELGLVHANDWQQFVVPVAESLRDIMG